MHSFKDSKGRVWDLSITNATIKRVRGRLGLDLRDLIQDGGRGFGELIDDEIRLGEVVFAALDPADVTQEDFDEACGGDVNAAMQEAFAEEFCDFFKDRSVRTMLRRMMEKAKQLAELARAELIDAVEKIDPQSALETLRNGPSQPPASAELTPDPSPSGN